ncbi:MAG: hypothetical protein IJS20_07805 [Bacteroidales bacterium]|nr:hypothetical protein [Bacteroidales bacterium]
MSEINGAGLGAGGKLPDSVGVSAFGEYTPEEYAELIAEKMTQQSTSHGIATLSSTTVGDIVSWAGYTWRVIHNYGSTVLLGAEYAEFGSGYWCTSYNMGNSSGYAWEFGLTEGPMLSYFSTIATSMSNNDRSCIADNVIYDRYGEHTGIKIRAITETEVKGALSYFQTSSNRVFRNKSETAVQWHTMTCGSSSGSSIYNYTVTTAGAVNSTAQNNSHYYRPFVTVYIA